MIIQNKKTIREIMFKIPLSSGDSEAYLGRSFFNLESYSVFANETSRDDQE